MSRLVTPKSSAAELKKGISDTGEYAERVSKYVPAEILAGYSALNGILSAVTSDESWVGVTYVAVFLLCLILTPVYFNKLAGPEDRPARVHIAVSTVAFIVWAYSLGGVFLVYGLYRPALGAISLILFTLVSGVFVPRKA